jgi:hypothetical protein
LPVDGWLDGWLDAGLAAVVGGVLELPQPGTKNKQATQLSSAAALYIIRVSGNQLMPAMQLTTERKFA